MNLGSYKAGCKLTSGHMINGKWVCVYCKKKLNECTTALERIKNENTAKQRAKRQAEVKRVGE